jgi:intein/homing endonuclease
VTLTASHAPVYSPSMVRKRDGHTVQPYDRGKIERAVRRAWAEVGAVVDEAALEKVVAFVGAAVAAETAGVEEIQNAVEVGLMRAKQFDVAKAYILHRQKRSEVRAERKSPDHRAISDYVHASKYARWREDLGRREVYLETVHRVRDMHKRRYPQLETEIDEAFAAVERKEVLPSMRGMQFSGAAIEKNNLRSYNCSGTLTDRPRAFAEAMYLQLCGCGVGYSVQLEHVDKLPALTRIDALDIHHHVVADTIEGWADALDALVNSYMSPKVAEYGKYVEFSYFVVRDRGVPLKTSGGRAPGHVGLKKALELVRGVLDGAQGRKLRPIEAHRVHCMSFEAVLSGGIRRAAAICLFSPEDGEIMACKSDASWFSREPSLANANNSVVLLRGEENQRAFKRVFEMAKAYGEPGIYFAKSAEHMTNPCFSPDTRLATAKGMIRVEDLAREDATDVMVDTRVHKHGTDPEFKGIKRMSATPVKLTGVSRPIYRVKTSHGYEVTTTDTHAFITTRGRVQLKDLHVDDVLMLQSGEGLFGDGGDYQSGLVLGLYVSDGTSTHSKKEAYVDLWPADFGVKDVIRDAVNHVVATIPSKYDRDYGLNNWYSKDDSKLRIGSQKLYSWLASVADNEQVQMLKERVPETLWRGSREFIRGYLHGMFLGDGTLNVGGHEKKQTVSWRLGSVKPDLLRDVQMLLAQFGVVCRIYHRKEAQERLLPDGKGGEAFYPCQAFYELTVSRPNLVVYRQRVGMIGRKANRIDEALEARGVDCSKPERYITNVTSIETAGVSNVYCLTQKDTNSVIANGIVIGQCSEAGLDPTIEINGQIQTGWSFCNLSEINASKLKTKDDFLRAARAATIIGTLQAGYTDFPYIGEVSEKIARRDALLGVGMTGMQDAPLVALNPEFQREVAEKVVEWNKEIADKIGINSAARTTLVKPSGTSSLELDYVASGIHPHHARRIIRRVTADELEIPFQAYRAANPHACTKKPDGKWVVEFALEAPPGATVRDDLSASKFLEQVMSTQKNWVLPGTGRESRVPGHRHSVSNTVTVCPDEWASTEEFTWAHREDIACVSMLPHAGDTIYPFAPFEAVITEAQERRWNELIAKYVPVDYAALSESQDSTTPTGEAACAGGACQLT